MEQSPPRPATIRPQVDEDAVAALMSLGEAKRSALKLAERAARAGVVGGPQVVAWALANR